MSEFAIIRTDLAAVRNLSTEYGLSYPSGFMACPYLVQRGFFQISDFPSWSDDKTTKIAIPVDLHQKVFPRFRTDLFHSLRVVCGKFQI